MNVLRLCLVGIALLTAPASAQSRGPSDLTIGMTQFPATLHPSIESMVAKSYVLAMARRPFTVYDADWRLICMLCAELPTIENGGAVPETAPNGKPGIAVTYTI
ncbi:MAG: peptide ABC transporter substrate-binding protein, partial [Alphaproteobacteria bacterium]|nr:peptide ABC transporter substrate-binding protein [Alphaproteobacteria bacterium]